MAKGNHHHAQGDNPLLTAPESALLANTMTVYPPPLPSN